MDYILQTIYDQLLITTFQEAHLGVIPECAYRESRVVRGGLALDSGLKIAGMTDFA